MHLGFGLAYLILAPFIGGLLAGLDRKITARMQSRKGPPLLQPFYDVLKLFSKQNAVVNAAQNVLIYFYMFFCIFTGFIFFIGGDLLLVVFSFTLASVFLVLCAYSSNSPFSAMGASRELMQILCYEPAVLLMGVGMYMVTGSFRVCQIISGDFPTIFMLPGVFIAFMYILLIKLRKSPFDLSTSHHAHQEMVKGVTTEISGPDLALVEISHWYESVLIWGLVYLFFGFNSLWSILIFAVIFAFIFVIEIFFDNVCARVKWQYMLKTSWALTASFAFINLLLIAIIS